MSCDGTIRDINYYTLYCTEKWAMQQSSSIYVSK